MGKISLTNSVFQTSGNTENLSSLSGKSDVHIFIDEQGNVTQIKKSTGRKRLKFYIDPEIQFYSNLEWCVIGVSDEESGACSYGIAMGCGDVGSSTEMAFARYYPTTT